MAKKSGNDMENLDKLGERIGAARVDKTPQEVETEAEARSRQRSSRAAYDLMAALLVGPGLGWLVDRQFGTTPWGVLIGLVIGFTAGLMNAWRTINGVERAVGLRNSDKTEQGNGGRTPD